MPGDLERLPREADKGLLIMNATTNLLALSLATLVTMGGAQAYWEPDDHHQRVALDGVALDVTLHAAPGAQTMNLDLQVINETDQDFALPGDDSRHGLEFWFVTEDGREIRDGASAEADPGRRIQPGEVRAISIDLARHPLYLTQQGFLDVIVPLEGVFDEKLAAEPAVYLHVRQLGDDGGVLKIDPIRVVLSGPQLYARQAKFGALHAGTMVWDPTLPIHPTPNFTPGVVVLQFAKHVPIALARGIVAAAGYEIRSEANYTDTLRVLTVNVPEGEEKEALAFFRSDERIAYSDLDYVMSVM